MLQYTYDFFSAGAVRFHLRDFLVNITGVNDQLDVNSIQ